jgi:hypothetical protein
MPDLHLEELVLYQLLQRRENSRNATLLAGLLQKISSDARAHLEFIRASFPSYTDHSLQHSFRIAHALGEILSDEAQKNLTSVELFAFLMAAMFHDVGMVADDGKGANQVRHEHPLRSGEFIQRYLKERLNILSEDNQRLGALLAFVVECHGLTWEQMVAREEFQHPDMIMREKVRPPLLAILLRVGDLLDLDAERSSGSVRRCTPGFIQDPTSRLHHDRHGHVSRYYLSPDKIQITVKSHSKAETQLWTEWFGYLRQDIEHANTQIFREALKPFSLPRHELRIEDLWVAPVYKTGDFYQPLDRAVNGSPGDVELWASIGEGDFLTSWLARLDHAPGKLKRVRVRCLADGVIDEQFREPKAREEFKGSLQHHLKKLADICQKKGIELAVSHWQTPAPFHGFICGDHALVGAWTRDSEGVPHVKTPLQHFERTRHPAEFAEYLKKFEG